jgi:hypothetical protein
MLDFVEKTSDNFEMESVTSGLIESQKILLIDIHLEHRAVVLNIFVLAVP